MKVLWILLICLLVQSQIGFAQTPAPVDLGLLNGKAKTLAPVVYPEKAKKSGVNGAVKINVTVDERGNVIKADAIEGELLLRDAALAAARATIFEPYLVKGKAVKFTGFLVFNFVAPKSDYFGNFDDINKQLIELSKAEAGVNQDIFELKKNPDSLKKETNKIGSKDSEIKSQNVTKKTSENQCSDGRGLVGGIHFEVFTDTNKWEWVSLDKVREYIKICDETIKENPNQSLPYYTRGLARYYLIRGFVKPLIKTLSDTETVSAEEMRLSLADLQIFIKKQVEYNNKTKNGFSSEELKMAYLAAGELTAVFGVKSNSANLIQSAVDLWTTGEKMKTLSDDGDVQKNKVMAADREVVNQILAEASRSENSPSAADDAKARYQKYAADYSSKENIYKQNLANFQAALKARQTAATTDNAQICRSLVPMNSSFQSLKNSFAPIVAMKTKGELTDPNLISQVETRDAQHAKIQASVGAAAAKYGCQLK